MYKWVKEVDNLVSSLVGELNNRSLQIDVKNNIIEILNKHKVIAYVNCGQTVNTPEVIDHGEFRALVETQSISMMFKLIRVVK